MLIGTISKIIPEKGIGFITPCDRGDDVFFHFTAVPDEQFDQLQEGQAVSFDLDRTVGKRNRPRAARVVACDPILLGRTAPPEAPPDRHPRARRRKPTWRE